MGLNDRDYYREDSTGGPKLKISATLLLIIVNVLLYLADSAVGHELFNNVMPLTGSVATSPLQWYRLLTYGFAHDPNGLMHIVCNMLVLFFFGFPLERKYGKAEFLIFYLVATVFAGAVWSVLHIGSEVACLGASGAITALVILFAFTYPRAQIWLWAIIPMPAWLAGVLFVLYDAFMTNHGADNVAHDVHLSGAAFAAIYFFSKIRFTKLFSGKRAGGGREKSSDRPTYTFAENQPTLHRSTSSDTSADRKFKELESTVDQILMKISEHGEDSLTEQERETLRYASREYQKRRGRN
ncbi:MAG: rhomboid family intramembrane serine protease [Thermoguttaceae bacterium]|nr:rhomboid family intramembrane serine protease [Thermoguttaceae bacterium]